MSGAAHVKKPPFIWFPLLAKELTEKASRLRTYWIRIAYALTFFGYFGFEGYELLNNATALSGLGTGGVFFEKIYRFQLIGTLLFLPALMSGLITQEKERDSLSLLLTTDLAPWRIIVQKYAGGLVPMLGLQLTALPMTAVAYSLGNVEARDIWIGSGLLIVHTLNMGAFYIACSAYCSTSVGAFLCAYLLGSVWFAILVPITSASVVLGFPLPPNSSQAFDQMLLIRILPIFAIFWLALATYWLRTRAETSRKNRLRAVFRLLDRAFNRVNGIMGGVNLAKGADSLPESKPVRWRELHQRSLAQPHYLIRIGLVVEIATVAVILYVASQAAHWRPNIEVTEMSRLFFSLWALYSLVLIVQGTNIIGSERNQQTLEVLLTTPMLGSTILREKAVVFGRIAIMAIIPLGTVCWAEGAMEYMPLSMAIKYGAYSLLAFIVVSAFVFWLAVTVGLLVRSRFRALLTSMIILIALCSIPNHKKFEIPSVMLNPAMAITYNEMNLGKHTAPSVWGGTNFARRHFGPSGDAPGLSQSSIIHSNLMMIGLWAFALRFYCLRRADKLLGRAV